MKSKKVVLVDINQGIELSSATWIKGEGNLWRITYSWESKIIDYSYGIGSWGLQPYGESGTALIEKEREPLIKVGSLSIDGDFYVEADEYNILYNNSNTYTWENQILTIHTPEGVTPNSFNSVMIGMSKGYTNHAGWYDNIYYDGRLSSISSITLAIDNLYNGIPSYESCSINLINSDGYFDHIRDNNIYGQKVKVYYGEDTNNIDDFIQVYEGIIESFQPETDVLSLNTYDPRKTLSKSIPENKFEKINYPKFSDNGKYIPLSYGEINNAEAFCLNETDGLSLFEFKLADTEFHPIKSINTVYVEGEEVSVYSEDLSLGTFKLESSVYSSGDSVTASFSGYVDDEGVLIEDPIDIIEDILFNYTTLFFDDSLFNIVDWNYVKSLSLPNINLYLEKQSTLIDIIVDICKSLFCSFIVQADGRYTLKIRDVEKEPVKTIYVSEHVDTFSLEESGDEYVSEAKIGYDKKYSEDEYTYYTNDELQSSLFSKYQLYSKKEFETLLVNESDALDYSKKILDIYGGYSRTLTITTKTQHTDLELEDLIDVEIYGYNNGEDEFYGSIRMEITSLEYNLNDFKITITGRWIKDVTDNISLYKMLRWNDKKTSTVGTVSSSGGQLWRAIKPSKGLEPELNSEFWERYLSINWNEFTGFKIGQITLDDNVFYTAKTKNINVKPSTSIDVDWEYALPQGEQGEQGVDGESGYTADPYNPNRDYIKDELCILNAICFICLQDCSGQEPDVYDQIYWDVFQIGLTGLSRIEDFDFMIGIPQPFLLPSSKIPTSMISATGQLLTSVDYPKLFAKYKYTYGGSEESGLFGVPNLQGVGFRGKGKQSVNERLKGSDLEVGEIWEDEFQGFNIETKGPQSSDDNHHGYTSFTTSDDINRYKTLTGNIVAGENGDPRFGDETHSTDMIVDWVIYVGNGSKTYMTDTNIDQRLTVLEDRKLTDGAYMHLQHTTEKGTSGGAIVAGSWQPAPLNLTEYNNIDGATLNTETYDFTLPAGKYIVSGFRALFYVNRYSFRLFNVTESISYLGMSGYADQGDGYNDEHTPIQALIEINQETVFRFEVWCQTSYVHGWGYNGVTGYGGLDDVWSDIFIQDVSRYQGEKGEQGDPGIIVPDISELTELSSEEVDLENDMLIIFDASTGSHKKISLQMILNL